MRFLLVLLLANVGMGLHGKLTVDNLDGNRIVVGGGVIKPNHFFGLKNGFKLQPAVKKQQELQKCIMCLRGAAVGDALGRVTEFISSVDQIFQKYPYGVRSVKDFKDSDWSGVPSQFKEAGVAPYTDDTAMSILVLDALIEARQKNYDMNQTMGLIAKKFVDDSKKPLGWAAPFRAPGNCCRKYVSKLEQLINSKGGEARRSFNRSEDWRVSPANGQTGGCGTVMHAYPFGMVFSDDPQKAKIWAAEHSELTHGDAIAKAACAAMAVGTAYAIQGKGQDFIIEQMISAAREYDAGTAKMMEQANIAAGKAKATLKPGESAIEALKNSSHPFRKAHDQFFNKHQGWAAHEAIAGVVYIFTMFPEDLETAIFLGVHTAGDSDSIASLAGALVGAYSGYANITTKSFWEVERFGYPTNKVVAGDKISDFYTSALNLPSLPRLF